MQQEFNHNVISYPHVFIINGKFELKLHC